MLALPVSAEVHLALEGLFAEATRERLVARVLPHVRDQVRRLGERFSAHHALVGFLAWKEAMSLAVLVASQSVAGSAKPRLRIRGNPNLEGFATGNGGGLVSL